MGSKSSKQEINDIMNTTDVQIALSNMNENINNMAMEIIQTNLQKNTSGAQVGQSITLKNSKVAGDVVISGVSQDADVKINISALLESELKQDLITETLNQLQTKLQETMETTQAQSEENGEQVLSEMMNALKDAITAVVPGSNTKSSTETTLSNLLNINSETELKNIIEQTVTTELVNENITEIANTLIGNQTIDLSSSEFEGTVTISEISQKFASEQILDSISRVGTGVEIISGISSTSSADVEKALSTKQEAKTAEIGTFSALGDMANNVLTAVSSVVSSAGLTVILPFLVIGGVLLFLFKPLITAVVGSKMGVDMNEVKQAQEIYATPQQTYQPPAINTQDFAYPPMAGGGIKGGLDFIKSMSKLFSMKVFTDYFYLVYGWINKNVLKFSLVGIILSAVISLMTIYWLFLRTTVNKKIKETYTNLADKLTNLLLKSKGKHLSVTDDNVVILTDDDTEKLKLDAILMGKNKIYFVKKQDIDLYLMSEDDKLVLKPFEFSMYKNYVFSINKIDDDNFYIKHKNKYVNGKEELNLGKNKQLFQVEN